MDTNTTSHMYGVMLLNQKHLRMQMMVQVHTSKLQTFVFYLGWNAHGPCLSHLSLIWPKGLMMKYKDWDLWKAVVAKSLSKSFEMLMYLSQAVNWSEWTSSPVFFASLFCDKEEMSAIHLEAPFHCSSVMVVQWLLLFQKQARGLHLTA